MLLNSFSHQKKNIKSSVPGSLIINIKSHADETTVKSDRGDYIRCFEVTGFDYKTVSHDQLISWTLLKKRMYKALSHPDVAIWTTHIHEKYQDNGFYENVALKSKFSNPVAQKVYDDHAANVTKDMYINRFFISIVMRGLDSLDAIRKLLDPEGVKLQLDKNLTRLQQKSKIIETDFSGVNVRPLGIREENGKAFSEIAEFYGRIYNGRWSAIPLTYNDLNEIIPTSGLLFNKETIEQRDVNECRYGALLTVKDYDGDNNLNQFNDLLGLPFPFIMTQSFSFLSQLKAEYVINNVKKEMVAAGSGSDDFKEIESLLKQLKDGESVFGSFHATFFSSSDDINKTADNLNIGESILRKGGLITVRSLYDAQSCFLAQLPGNFKEITFAVPVTNDNFSLFSPLYNVPIGNKDSNYWGDASFLGKTSLNTPKYVSLHEEDVGHAMFLGSTGTGKTVLQNFTILCNDKVNPSITFFDSKRNAEILIDVLGGKYYNISLGKPTGFAPFQMEPTEKNKLFMKDLVQMMAEFIEEGLTLEQVNDISWAIESLTSNDIAVEDRTVTTLHKIVPNQGKGNLGDRLTMWMKGYKYGWIFDNNKDTLDVSHKKNGFNMDELIDKNNHISALITAYLWHRIEEKKTGGKGIIIFEEYHQLLTHPFMVEKMGRGLKMDRDKNFSYIFTSQSVSDALNSPISAAIKEQIGTYFLLSNPRGVLDEYKIINVTEKEFNIIKSLDKSSRKGIFKQGHESTEMNFDLSHIKKFIPILSANKKLINIFEKCKKEHNRKYLIPYLKEAQNV